MYIYSRLFGIFTYCLTLLIFLFFIKNDVNKRNSKVIFFFFLLFLTIIAYFYAPAPEADLYRIQIYAIDFSKYSWSEFFSLLMKNQIGLSSTPISAILYRILGLTGNVKLISAFSCAFTYGLVFYVIFKESKRLNVSSYSLFFVVLLMFSMDYYMPVIATIRSYLASVLIFFNIYLENKNGKINIINLLIYLVAILTHSIGIVLVIIRFISLIFQKSYKLTHKIIYLMIIFLTSIFLFSSADNLLIDLINRFSYYSSSNDSYSYAWEYICLFIMLFIQCSVLYTLHNKKRILKNFKLDIYYDISKFCAIILILFCWQFSFFQRISFFLFLLEIPLMLLINNKKIKLKYIILNKSTLLIFVLMLLTVSRGYLCSLKFW